MKRYIFYLTLLLLIFPGVPCLASHIVGGEMNYRFLGNNDYEITLTVYRDCFNGIPPFDDPASIGIFDDRGNLINTIEANITRQQSVPNAINSPCVTPPTNVCYELAQYVFTTTIPAGSGACTIAYQRCCRNYSIINIDNVMGTGATYMTVIADPLIAPVNSSPVFNLWPPTFICKDAPFTFDHSATDLDGDSLVYGLCYPNDGADIVIPIPNPPGPPPYSPIVFLPPYSLNDPFGGVPLHIDSITGIMKATPNSEGQFVYGISVKEYRNGVYVGETRRDFQVNVVSCPAYTVASILSPTIACGTFDAHFINNSFNASSYKWSFGDSTIVGDTSSIINPFYAYPDTGDYLATLIAYSPNNSSCNDTTEGIVHIYPLFQSDFFISNNHCSNVFSFADQSYGINGVANFWSWNFGDNSISSVQNPVHVYNSPGEYNVILSSSADSACLDTIVKRVFVLPIPKSNFTLLLDTCSFTIKTKNSSSFAVSYQWDYGDSNTDYNFEGNHNYINPGDYNIQLIVASDSFCLDTSYIHISIPPLPVADFYYDALLCDSNVQFQNLSQNAKEFIWDFGDSEISNLETPSHIYSQSGFFPVQLTAISVNNCQVITNKNIFFMSRKKADYDTRIDSCKGLLKFIDVTKGATNYYWQFGDGGTSQDQTPVHKYLKEGKYNVLLTVNHETICSDSVLKTVTYEAPLGEKVFIPNSFSPNGDGHNDLFEISIFRPCEIYKLTIFNRWGQKVFESDDASNIHWDGSFNGEKLAEDIYVYILESSDNRRQGIISIFR